MTIEGYAETIESAVNSLGTSVDEYVARDIVGAYRAGYDYLDVYLRTVNPGGETHVDDFTLRIGVRCIPRERTPVAPPNFKDGFTARRIDLREVRDETFDEVREEVLR